MVQVTSMHAPESNTAARHASNGARAVTADGRTLPLVHAMVTAEASGGIARVVLKQRFANPYAERLAVRYLLPLPANGAPYSAYAPVVCAAKIER